MRKPVACDACGVATVHVICDGPCARDLSAPTMPFVVVTIPGSPGPELDLCHLCTPHTAECIEARIKAESEAAAAELAAAELAASTRKAERDEIEKRLAPARDAAIASAKEEQAAADSRAGRERTRGDAAKKKP